MDDDATPCGGLAGVPTSIVMVGCRTLSSRERQVSSGLAEEGVTVGAKLTGGVEIFSNFAT